MEQPRLAVVHCNDERVLHVLPWLAGVRGNAIVFTDWAVFERERELVKQFQPDALLCAWSVVAPKLFRERGSELDRTHLPKKADCSDPNLTNLTRRQVQLLTLLRAGLRNAEIATQLRVSTRAVKYYLSELFSLFEVSNRTELLGSAVDLGIFDRQSSADLSQMKHAAGAGVGP